MAPGGRGLAAFSAVIFVLLWDGKRQRLDGKGLFAILINIVILVSLLMLQWPNLGF